MKIPLIQQQQQRSGFTLAEMMVAVGVLGLLGIVFFSVLKSGIVLFAKNTAVNIAHEEAREGINRLTRDIHASVSMPQLCDLITTTSPVTLSAPSPSPTPISGVAVGPMFAAVSFQNVSNGPNYIWKDPPSGMIMINDNYKVTNGQHLLIPFWGALFEQDIIKNAALGSANHSNIWLANRADTNINPRDYLSGSYAITYYTERIAYVVMNGTFYSDNSGLYTRAGTWSAGSSNFVWATPDIPPGHRFSYQNGELHQFRQRYTGSNFYWEDAGTVARNLTSAMPFYSPLNTGGGFNPKYVGVKITATDVKVTNQKFIAVNSLMDTAIDYRTAIALTQ
jgi:prepilin-type N-terminal cleavage/methylation domain-containing protein